MITEDPQLGLHGLGRDHFVAVVRGAFTTNLPPIRRTLTGVLLLMMADIMRSRGTGGTILIVPSEAALRQPTLSWLDFGLNSVGDVSFESCFEKYDILLQGDDPLERASVIPGIANYLHRRRGVDPDLREPTAVIGSLCGIDGAVVLSDQLEILGFGAMVRPPATATLAADTIHRRSLLDYTDEGRPGEDVPLSAIGGARRQSGARFVVNNYGTVAITVSHDGPVSVALWVENDPAVNGPRAHLITDTEILLD